MITEHSNIGRPASTIQIADIAMTDMYTLMIREQRENPGTAYRFLRGHKCQTESDLFDEFAAALQFPYYFGENWDALEECCRDLGNIHLRAHCVVVGNAHYLLKNSSERSFHLFAETMNRVIQYSQTNTHGFHFTILLQSESSSFEVLRERLVNLRAFFSIASISIN